MKIQKYILGSLVAVGLPSLSLAATVASQDFESGSLTAGTTPAGTDFFTGNLDNGNQVLVVDGTTTPQNQITGGAGNKSIYIHRSASDQDSTLPMFQYNIPGYGTSTPLASGSVSFDIYLETVVNGRNAIEINLGTIAANTGTNGRSNSFASFQINASTATTPGAISYFNNTTSGGSISSSAAVMTPNAKNTITVSWSNDSKMYSIALNGTTIVSSAFTVSGIQGLSSIRFTTVNSALYTDLNYYIDNITVSDSAIPEPKTAAMLVGCAGLALAVGSRKAVR